MSVPLSVVTVNYNTYPFIKSAFELLNALTTREFEFLVCDNGSGRLDQYRLKQLAASDDRITLFRRHQDERPSLAHGRALNLLVEEMSGDYGVFLDADAAFLQTGWDDILINHLDDQHPVIGTPPVENPVKPTDFPSVYATLFDVQTFRELDIDMTPEDPSVGKDTGWEMRVKFLDADYRSVKFEVRSTREYTNGPFGNITCAEYYLGGLDGIIASHFGRGASLGAAKYLRWWPLGIPVLGPLPKKLLGLRERRKWIRRCHEVGGIE